MRGVVAYAAPMDDSVPAPPGSGRILTVPNVITLGRLLCVPVFLWQLRKQ